MNSPDDERSDDVNQILAATRTANAAVKRQRIGVAGSEPSEVRKPLWRGYVATYVVLVSLIFALVNLTEVAAVLILVALAAGTPKAWLWANDRLSSAAWMLGVVLLVAAEVAYLAGGHGARNSLSVKGHPGSADILLAICALLSLVGFFRRWGTSGQPFYATQRNRKGDPVSEQLTYEAAEKEGWTPPGAGDGS